MTEATVVRWLVAPGERVVQKQPLVEIETEKIVTDIESPATGVLSRYLAVEGDVATVAQVIAWILIGGEAADDIGPFAEPPKANLEEKAPNCSAPALPSLPPRSAPAAASTLSSPAVRRLAREQGVDLRDVVGSGPGGRIVKEDVFRAGRERNIASDSEEVLEPLSAMRRAIVRTVTESAAIPQIALYASADVSQIIALRDEDQTIAYEDILILAVAKTLQDHKYLNGSYEEAGIRLKSAINVGLAVAVDNGLLIPVIREPAKLSLKQIGIERRRLVQRVQSGQIAAQDLAGGTFTITNLGMFPVDRFTALVNPSQAAILSVGRMQQVASPDDEGAVAFRPRITFGLSIDHRVADGAAGAAFLQDLIARLEHPDWKAV